MNIPRKINPDNLIETIIEIRMTPNHPSELWAGMLSGRLGDLGYNYISSPAVNIRVDQNGKLALSIEQSQNKLPAGIFVKDSIRFIMQGDRLLFNCNKGGYVGWAIYEKEIYNVINAVKESGIAKDFNRVNIRYISEYVELNIIDKIKYSINYGNTEHQFETKEIKLTRSDEDMKIYVSIANNVRRKSSNKEEDVVSLFDISVYENFIPSDSLDNLRMLLEKIHKAEKETFFGILKKEFIETLNPEY